jgi:hypothetical protein
MVDSGLKTAHSLDLFSFFSFLFFGFFFCEYRSGCAGPPREESTPQPTLALLEAEEDLVPTQNSETVRPTGVDGIGTILLVVLLLAVPGTGRADCNECCPEHDGAVCCGR